MEDYAGSLRLTEKGEMIISTPEPVSKTIIKWVDPR